MVYRGTSFIRNASLIGPYSRTTRASGPRPTPATPPPRPPASCSISYEPGTPAHQNAHPEAKAAHRHRGTSLIRTPSAPRSRSTAATSAYMVDTERIRGDAHSPRDDPRSPRGSASQSRLFAQVTVSYPHRLESSTYLQIREVGTLKAQNICCWRVSEINPEGNLMRRPF